jgi:hypothetical protein
MWADHWASKELQNGTGSLDNGYPENVDNEFLNKYEKI